MIARIVAFDHARSVLKNIMETCSIDVIENLDMATNADLAICHIGPDESDWNSMIGASKDGAIRIRTSSVGRLGFTHKVLNKGVIILELQISHDPARGGVTENQWRKIIDEIINEGSVARIVQGDVPDTLFKYFGSNEPQYLPALSILCQGYLAAQAGRDGKADVSDANDVISEALTMMGWDSICGPVMAGHETGKSRRDEVVKPEFWDVFDVEQEGTPEQRIAKLRATVLAVAKKEWGQENDLEFVPVQTLIGMIGSEINNPTLVAEVYLALAKRLGGSNVS